MTNKFCTELFAHSLDKMSTVETTADFIIKKCSKCGYTECLPRSKSSTYFLSNLVTQKKKWAADSNKKELLQPLNRDGSVNEEFTEAFGYNPFDERTKATTPKVQGGMAQ